MQTSIWYDPMFGPKGNRTFKVIEHIMDLPFLGYGDRQTIKLRIKFSPDGVPWDVSGRFRQELLVMLGKTTRNLLVVYPSQDSKTKSRDSCLQRDLAILKEAGICLPDSLQ